MTRGREGDCFFFDDMLYETMERMPYTYIYIYTYLDVYS